MAGPLDPTDRMFGIKVEELKPIPGTSNVLEQLAAAVAPISPKSPLDGLGN